MSRLCLIWILLHVIHTHPNASSLRQTVMLANVYNSDHSLGHLLSKTVEVFSDGPALFLSDVGEDCVRYSMTLLEVNHAQLHIAHIASVNMTSSLYQVFKSSNTRREQLVVMYGSSELIRNAFALANRLDAEFDQHGYYTFIYKWLIIPTDSRCEHFIDAISDVTHVLCFDFLAKPLRQSSAVLFDRCDETVKLKTLVFGDSSRRFSDIHLITSSKNRGTQIESLFPNVKYKLNGRRCRIGAQYWEPHLFIRVPGNASSQYEGFYYDIVQLYARVLNCTAVIMIAPNFQWGVPLENGSWTGIVGQLQQRHVDFTMPGLTVTSSRMEVMDFADFPLQFVGVYGAYKSPGSIPFGVASVAKPFSSGVWLAAVIAVFLYPLFVVVHRRLTQLILSNKQVSVNGRCFNVTRTLKDVLHKYVVNLCLISAISLSQAISLRHCRNLSSRCVWSAWVFFALFLVYIWSANIISYLTVVKKSEPISSFEDLLESDFKYGTTAGTSTETFLKDSASKVHRQIHSNVVKFRRNWPDMGSGLQNVQTKLVLQGEYVFIAEEDGTKYLVAAHCDVVLMDEILYTVRYAVGLQRNSAYKPLVNRITLMLHESGMFDDLLRKLYSELETCDSHQERRQISLGVTELNGIFIAFGAALGVCIIAMYLEIAWFTMSAYFKGHCRIQKKNVSNE